MPQPDSTDRSAKSDAQAINKKSYLTLAGIVEGGEKVQRVHKKDPHAEALRTAGDMFEMRDYVAAYECFKPVYEKVVADMQRVLARNAEFEANKLAKQLQKPLAVAKENVKQRKAHAQQVIDQFEKLLDDLERKPLVRAYLKKGGSVTAAAAPAVEEPPPTTLNSANETRLNAKGISHSELESGNRRYEKRPYAPPENGMLYSVREKAGSERVIRVIGVSPDGSLVQVESLEDGKPTKQPIQLTVELLARQAAKGWCSLLLPLTKDAKPHVAMSGPTASGTTASGTTANTTMRLDSQNFGRCCGDIARANIKFGTQPIKDVGDGPFRAGDYEQAFLTFEQLSIGFNSAVASSRRAIADGRRELTAQKGNLSGREIQERTAAFTRSEQLIHTAEREFSTILEGLRMYLRAQRG